MDYLTEHYFNKCKALQERIEHLSRQIQEAQNPEDVIFRAAKIYGQPTEFGHDWPGAAQGAYFPLKNFDDEVADDVLKKRAAVLRHLGGDSYFLGLDAVQKRKPTEIEIDKLRPTQPFVDVNDRDIWGIKLAGNRPKPISVVTHRGIPYIIDGHHSYVAAKLTGAETVPAINLNLDEFDIDYSEPSKAEPDKSEEMREKLKNINLDRLWKDIMGKIDQGEQQ